MPDMLLPLKASAAVSLRVPVTKSANLSSMEINTFKGQCAPNLPAAAAARALAAPEFALAASFCSTDSC